MDDCLVYFFTGFLDSGKTSCICSWLTNDNFKNRKSVVICTEEGDEEFDEEHLGGVKPVVINCETDEVTKEMTFDIEEKYSPSVVFIEWNGTVSPAEFFDKVDVPDRWALAAAVVVIDASTYSNSLKNMTTFFADYFRYGDTVIFNRVDPDNDNLPRMRASVKAVNPGMSINFVSKDNEIVRIEDHLPYDLKQNPCHITADDFGLFYTDSMDNRARYEGKRVSLIGEAIPIPEYRGKAFALERQAYTCCAADLQPMGILCLYQIKPGFPAGQWVKVTGTIRYFEDKTPDGQKIAVPCLQAEEYALTSKPDNDVIYFN